MNAAIASVCDLSIPEKHQLIEDLWVDVASDPAGLRGFTEKEIEELDRRKAELEHDPDSGLSWDEVKRRIRSRYGR